MFTGIVEEMGTIRSIRRGAHSAVLSIGAELVLSDLKIGDSVAVNGVCLTATGKDSGGFTADVMHETLNRSSLGTLVPGSRVNLERAMAAAGRFGGHIVSGHIDGTGTITATAGEGGAIAPDGTVRVAQGADRTFTISAAEGYVIADVLVDGVCGTGFHGDLRPDAMLAARWMNTASGAVLALDIPSGVECDTGRIAPGAVQADCTVTFHAAKPCHTLAAAQCGEVVVADIGIRL